MDLIGNKVTLRPWSPDDAIDEMLWREDPEVVYFDPPAGTVFNQSTFSIFTVSSIHIGVCALYNQTPLEAQLGIRIGDRNYWGQGYGTESVTLLTDYAFTTPSVRRVWLKVLPDNFRAIVCYMKCGFQTIGTLALSGYLFVVMEKRR